MKKPVLIYNPTAGQKRKVLSLGESNTVREIKSLFQKYKIDVDFLPTKKAGDAKTFAAKAIKDGRTHIYVAGGDGTIGEAANGIVGSKAILGIIPIGTFMNVARMLHIPEDLEKAVMLLKIENTRTIDVGSVTWVNGEKMKTPYYFIESAGIGVEAELHQNILDMETGGFGSGFRIAKTITNAETQEVTLTMDDKQTVTKPTLITIANGAYAGAALKLSPTARLTDHVLTVTVYTMPMLEVIQTMIKLKATGKFNRRKVTVYKAKHVSITSAQPVPVHADARIFSETPVSFKIVPKALTVVTGFA